MIGYLEALFLTLVIELCVTLLFDRKSPKLLLAVVLANLVSHPIFGATLYAFPQLRGVPSVPIIEVFIVALEALLLILAMPERSKSFLWTLSLCMNAASYLAGVLIYHSWG